MQATKTTERQQSILETLAQTNGDIRAYNFGHFKGSWAIQMDSMVRRGLCSKVVAADKSCYLFPITAAGRAALQD